MDGFWIGLANNKIIWVSAVAWIIAQGSKIARGIIREKRFNFKWLLGTGGMPSSHSAAVSALAVAIGKESGFDSGLFAVSVMFAIITMFDAQTWRRSIGVQAGILNRMMDDIHDGCQIEENKLRELIGHTPVEVFVGAVIGILTAVLFYSR